VDAEQKTRARDKDAGQAKKTRLPVWLRRPLPRERSFHKTEGLLKALKLSTVCRGAACPNIHECYSSGTAAFLILGPVCTRACAFCNIQAGEPQAPDPTEPERLAQAAARMKLKHVVITSVTRDDLPDGGSAHFAAVIAALRGALPQSTVETLIPDFQGRDSSLQKVLDAAPDIVNHNVETHSSLYPFVRPQADYRRSLDLLRRVKENGACAKSGFMVGLGEKDADVLELLHDLKEAGCSIVTIGQYLRPSKRHPEVKRFVPPETFAEYARWGHAAGIASVLSAPLARSSYHAEHSLASLQGTDLSGKNVARI
jgi:lipoic acid synthetase